MASRRIPRFATAAALGGLALMSLAGGALAGQPSATQTESSADYRVELDIGPAAAMLTTAQAMTAASGEVMVETPSMATGTSMGSSGMSMPGISAGSMPAGMAMPGGSSTSMGPSSSMSGMSMMSMQMATTDDGQPVNHHLEVHVFDSATGAVIANPVPSIAITDNTTGATRTLSDVMAMYNIQAGTSDLHFGNNVFLQDGDTYTIQVIVGSDTVSFANVAPSGGMGLPTATGGSTGGMPASMP